MGPGKNKAGWTDDMMLLKECDLMTLPLFLIGIHHRTEEFLKEKFVREDDVGKWEDCHWK